MLHSCRNNNIVKHLHKKCFRLIYNDKSSSYGPDDDDPVSIHNKNIHILANEMLRVKNDLSPGIVTDKFLQQTQTQYNFQYHNNFRTTSV